MLIPSRKINFVHIPKAAGSSIGNLLNSSIELTKEDIVFKEEFQNYSELKGFKFPNHAPARVKKKYLGDEKYKEYFSFCFVRNPFSLLVSLYEYTHQIEYALFSEKGWSFNQYQKNILENSFEDWILNFPTGKCQTDWIFSDTGELLVDFIGKTENYDLDVSKLIQLLGISSVKSLKKNATVHKNYREYYSDISQSVVEKKYSKTLKLFGYDF